MSSCSTIVLQMAIRLMLAFHFRTFLLSSALLNSGCASRYISFISAAVGQSPCSKGSFQTGRTEVDAICSLIRQHHKLALLVAVSLITRRGMTIRNRRCDNIRLGGLVGKDADSN